MEASPGDAMAAAVHDIRSSVGSIRLALTSMLDDDDDAEFRHTMLSSAEEESRRLNAALTALPALVSAATDESTPVRLEVRGILQEAAEDAGRRQVEVQVSGSDGVELVARPASLRAALAAMYVVAADSGGVVAASATESDGRARVLISRADGAAIRWDRALVHALADSVGSTVDGHDGGFELVFGDG